MDKQRMERENLPLSFSRKFAIVLAHSSRSINPVMLVKVPLKRSRLALQLEHKCGLSRLMAVMSQMEQMPGLFMGV